MSTLVSGGTAGHNPALLPQHLADLERSGLRPEIITASGVYSVVDPDRIRQLIGGHMSRPHACGLGPCLAIPFLDTAGQPLTWNGKDRTGQAFTLPYVRLKPDTPRVLDGKPVKYESPKGSASRHYIPPGVGPLLTDPTAELLIVEGEKKALAGTQAGFTSLGLSGVWNWTQKRVKNSTTGRVVGPRKLIDDLDRIA
jgi:hypothetical protein